MIIISLDMTSPQDVNVGMAASHPLAWQLLMEPTIFLLTRSRLLLVALKFLCVDRLYEGVLQLDVTVDSLGVSGN